MSAVIDETHDPARASWVASAAGHADFPIQNLPYGVFAPADGNARIGVAIGDAIFDLAAAVDLLPEAARQPVGQPTLNALFALSGEVRRRPSPPAFGATIEPDHREALTPMLHDAAAVTMLLPAAIGDYTDFYVGIHHATNVGRLFRPDNPLLPNYKHVPIGYHGSASSIVLRGRRW